MQATLDKKSKKTHIFCGGVVIVFAQKMLHFKINKTKLPVVTREMLCNIGIYKCQKDDMFIFTPSCIKPTIVVFEQREVNFEAKEKKEGETTIDSKP